MLFACCSIILIRPSVSLYFRLTSLSPMRYSLDAGRPSHCASFASHLCNLAFALRIFASAHLAFASPFAICFTFVHVAEACPVWPVMKHAVPFVCLFVLFVCLFACLFVCLFGCLSVFEFVFVCLPVHFETACADLCALSLKMNAMRVCGLSLEFR